MVEYVNSHYITDNHGQLMLNAEFMAYVLPLVLLVMVLRQEQSTVILHRECNDSRIHVAIRRKVKRRKRERDRDRKKKEGIKITMAKFRSDPSLPRLYHSPFRHLASIKIKLS